MSIRTRILENADLLFRQAGIRSITMDDISRHLSISKKTLYQHFSNKAEIVQGVMKCHFEEETCDFKRIEAQANDPVEELILLVKWMRKTWQEIPTNMVFDIQKYYPESWAMFHDFKEDVIINSVKKNLTKGVELGLYRSELDIEIVAKIRVEQIEVLMNPMTFPPDKYPPAMVHDQSFMLFAHGLVTFEGKQLIYKYLETEE